MRVDKVVHVNRFQPEPIAITHGSRLALEAKTQTTQSYKENVFRFDFASGSIGSSISRWYICQLSVVSRRRSPFLRVSLSEFDMCVYVYEEELGRRHGRYQD